MIITNSGYALVGYFITSYPTRAHGIIVKYFSRQIEAFVYIKTPFAHKHNSLRLNLILPGTIIRDGDRKRAPFLVLGLAP